MLRFVENQCSENVRLGFFAFVENFMSFENFEFRNSLKFEIFENIEISCSIENIDLKMLKGLENSRFLAASW